MLDQGIRVKLKADFPVVKETLERIGIMDRRRQIIWPSCYCVHGRRYDEDEPSDVYYIVHFKQLFELDGAESTFSHSDNLRLKTITYLLTRWDLVEPVDASQIDEILADPVDVLNYDQKPQYKIVHKYRFTRHVDPQEMGQPTVK